jgi:hypothetical protein
MLRNTNSIGNPRKGITNTPDVTRRLKLVDGTVALPSFSFENDPDTGWYHTGTANTMAASCGGSQIIQLGPSEVTASAKVVQVVTTRSGAGAIDVTGNVCKLTTTGDAQALTLADGVQGQVLTIVYDAEGASTNEATLTPTTANGYTSIVFDNVGDSVTLQFNDTTGWAILAHNRAVKPQFCTQSNASENVAYDAPHVLDSSWETDAEEYTNVGYKSWSAGILTIDFPGVYLLTGTANFTADATGERYVGFRTSSDLLGLVRYDANGPTGSTNMTTCYVCRLGKDETVGLEVFQNKNPSGTLACGGNTSTTTNRFGVMWVGE